MFTKLMKARQSIRYVITLLKLLWLKVKLNAINSLWKYINNFKKSLYQCVQTALTNVNANIQVLNFHRIKSLNLDILKLMTLPLPRVLAYQPAGSPHIERVRLPYAASYAFFVKVPGLVSPQRHTMKMCFWLSFVLSFKQP